MELLNKKHREILKNKLTDELKNYFNLLKQLPNDDVIKRSRETSKKIQVFDYVTSSLDFYDSEQLRAMLSTSDLLDVFYQATNTRESVGNVVSIPVENAIDDITWEYLDKLKQNKKKKPTIWDRITGFYDLNEDEYFEDTDNFYIPVEDSPLPKKDKSSKGSLEKFLEEFEEEKTPSKSATAIGDTISYLMQFKKSENKQNRAFNDKLNKLLPELKKMQYEEEFDHDVRQIEDKLREERSR